MENLNIETIKNRIDALSEDPDTTIGHLTNEEEFQKVVAKLKKNKEETTKIEKEKTLEIEKIFETDFRKVCFDYIKKFILKEEDNIEVIKEDMQKKGMPITEKAIKSIKNSLSNYYQDIEKTIITLRHETLTDIRKHYIVEELGKKFEDILILNDYLDSAILYELATREMKKDENNIFKNENTIQEIVMDFEVFNELKKEWTSLKEAVTRSNNNESVDFSAIETTGQFSIKTKEKAEERIIKLEKLMKDLFKKKEEKFLSDKYRDIFIKNNNVEN